MSLIRQTARAMAWNQAAKIVEVAGGFGVSVLLARLLAKEAYGLYGLALAVVGILALVADLGVRETFGRFLPEMTAAGRARYVVRRFLLIRLAVLAPLVVLLLAGGSLMKAVGLGALAPYAPLAAVILAGRALFALLEAYSLATLRVRSLALVRIAQSVLWVVSLLALLHFGWWGLGPVLAANAAALAVAVAALAVADRRVLAGPAEAVPLGGVLRFGAAVWAALLVNVGVEHGIDAVLIGALAGDAAEIARYNVGIYLAVSLFSFIVFAFSAIYLPSLSAARVHGGMEGLAAARAGYVKLMAGVVVPALAFLLVLAPQVVAAVYGPAYASSAVVLRIMCAALLVVALMGGGVNANTLLVMGRAPLFFWSRLVAGAVNTAADVLLIPRWGAVGAAAATASTIVGLHLFDLMMVRVLGRLGLPVRFLVRAGVATVGAVLLVAVAAAVGLGSGGSWSPWRPPWDLAAAAGAYAILYAFLWVIARPLEWSDREQLARVHPALGRMAGFFAAGPTA